MGLQKKLKIGFFYFAVRGDNRYGHERGFQEIWKLFAETDRQFKGLFLRNGVSEAVLDTFAFNAAEMADRGEIKELFEASIDAAVLMMNPPIL